MSGKASRQRLVDLARAVFSVFFFPIAFLMRLGYRLRRPLCGDTLYMLARRNEP